MHQRDGERERERKSFYCSLFLLSRCHAIRLPRRCTRFSSHGRAKLRVFSGATARKSTQLSPSLTRKPGTWYNWECVYVCHRDENIRAHPDWASHTSIRGSALIFWQILTDVVRSCRTLIRACQVHQILFVSGHPRLRLCSKGSAATAAEAHDPAARPRSNAHTVPLEVGDWQNWFS